jgi:hypothetical protein
MGWFVGSTNGVKTVTHGGDLANFHADMVLVPDTQWGIVLLMNGNNGLNPAPIANITVGVTDRLFGQSILPLAHTSESRKSILMFLWLGITLQLFEMLRTNILMRRWHKEPTTRPVGLLSRGWHLVPAPALNLAWAALLLALLIITPFIVGGDLPTLLIHVPDLGYSFLLTLIVALAWPLLRTVFVLGTLRTRVAEESKSSFMPLPEIKP